MPRKGPLLTLASGAALTAVLLTMSMRASSDGFQSADGLPPVPPAATAPPGDGGPPGESEEPGADRDGAAPGTPPGADPDGGRPGRDPQEGQNGQGGQGGQEEGRQVPDDASYTGRLDDGTALGITVTRDRASAYLCDGGDLEFWLSGTASDGVLALTGPAGTAIEGTYDLERARGTVTADGRRWEFSLPFSEAPAGLYRADARLEGGDADAGWAYAGWIVLPDGSQIGAASVNGVRRPAPPLDPRTSTARLGGSVISAEPVGSRP